MLKINGLGKCYGKHQALQGVSFDIQAGDIVALLGANGSGKTTTINAICGLIDFEQGEILFNGTPTRASRAYLQEIGAVLGGCRNINWRLTPEQNADYFARLRGAKPSDYKEEVALLMEKLGLNPYATKAVMKLSTGNKQKSALLSALSYQPKLLLLDEPTLGLDIDTVSALQDIILEQASRKHQAFLITSHDMSFIDRICSRVIVLNEGKMIFSGTIDELKRRLFKYQLQLQLQEADQEKLNGHLADLWCDKHQIERADQDILVNFNHSHQAFATIRWLEEQNIRPKALLIEELSIESAYRALLNDNAEEQETIQ